MLRVITKSFLHKELGVIKCINYKERLVRDLVTPWLNNYPIFKYDYVINMSIENTNLVFIITDEEDSLKLFKEKYDTERSS